MKWLEFIGVALRFGATAAEVVRERRRLGDTRPARVIWSEVRSKRIADEAARARREAFAREAARHGADFGERVTPIIPVDDEVDARVEAMAREATERMRRRE